MVNSLEPIKVPADGDLARILDDALEGPVLLERDGIVFRLSRAEVDSDIHYVPDVDLIHRTLDATVGSWSDLDIDQVIEDVYEARQAGSWPPDRP